VGRKDGSGKYEKALTTERTEKTEKWGRKDGIA
jgi:hypothetical protein